MVPKVSVIIPVYNSAIYLSKCLDSLLGQSYANLEIIIVNDGSTDESENIINEYKKKFNKIKYFYQENQGPSEARNKAIFSATGEYLIFVDADDTVNKFYVEKLLYKMISTNADLVCCGYKDISIYGEKSHTDFDFVNDISLHIFLEMVCKGTGGVLWGKIFKKEIILKSNLKMDKNIFMSEDLVFVLKYATHCNSFAAIKEYLYYYNRLNQASITSSISINYLENYITVCRYIEDILYYVNFDKEKLNKIITNKIQGVFLNLVGQQSKKLSDIGLETATKNVMILLSAKYIQKYKEDFTSKNLYDIPYLFFLKHNLVKPTILYGALINTLKSIKFKLKNRK